jgi:hypothetical protein
MGRKLNNFPGHLLIALRFGRDLRASPFGDGEWQPQSQSFKTGKLLGRYGSNLPLSAIFFRLKLGTNCGSR